MYLNSEQKDNVNKYIKKVQETKSIYSDRAIEVFEAILEYLNADYTKQDEKYNKLVDVIWTENTIHIRDIFNGDEYGSLKILLGEKNAKTFKEIWDRATACIYSMGYGRRSYRTNKSSKLYIRKNIEKLKEYVYLSAIDFSLEKYFQDNKEGYNYISVISDIIAVEVDNNNQGVFDSIREIIYSDNNTSIVTKEILTGLLMSKNENAHKLIGELLLAAKLQEGLRQSIVESIDECSKEGFIYILKLIIDNKLTRFSSIARAFCTWTGLLLDIEKPKVVNKCFEAAYKCLIDKEYQRQCIYSADNLLIYIGIWSVAFDEIEDIGVILEELINSAEKYKRLVALQFLKDTGFYTFRHKLACKALEDEELEVTALAIKNLFGSLTAYSLKFHKEYLKDYFKLNENCHGTKLFYKLKNIADMIGKKEVIFSGSVFPWVDIKLTVSEVIEKMILSIAECNDDNVIDILIDYKGKMSVDSRGVFVQVLLREPKTVKQRIALIESCGDRGSSVRDAAFKIVDDLELTNDDYNIVKSFLQNKSGDLRKNSIKMLLKQSSEELCACVQDLVNSKNENKRLAAIDIVRSIEEHKEHKGVYHQCLNVITSLKDVSQKESLLANNIINDVNSTKTLENGLGLYDKSKECAITPIEKPKDFDIKTMFSTTEEEFYEIFNMFGNLIHENRDFEYEVTDWHGTKMMITLGGEDALQPLSRDNHRLDNYPIGDKVVELVKLNNISVAKLIELQFYTQIEYNLQRNSYETWYEKIVEDNFNIKMFKNITTNIKNIPYYGKISKFISLLVNEISESEKFNIGKVVAEYLFDIIPEDKHYTEYINKNTYYYGSRKQCITSNKEVYHWLNLMRDGITNDDDFEKYFVTAYNYYKACDFNGQSTLKFADFGRALELGVIDESEVFKELIERPFSGDNISVITNLHRYNRDDLLSYTKLIEIANKVVDTVVSIEITRGELNTEVTDLAAKIKRCYGANIFTSIILSSEKDTYVRGYNFVSGDSTKKQMFSHILKCCYPKKDDNVETLKKCLKGKKVTDKQLVEAAMYSPQWLDIVSEYLGYKGLKSACWYFHAHVNDYFSEEKSSIIARFSPISSSDFRDGAFDQQWFLEAYKTVGEKNFKVVYDSAKYIAGGGLHRRAQLFADATLGKLDIDEVKNRVMDKRNKDYLLVYGLVPVKDKKDVLERYEYIHQYIKESKKFGAQRQASEGRSASIALLNLARNSGYSDVNRLSWNMETAKVDSIRGYLEPTKIDDIEVQLVIDELGQTDIKYKKDDKALKSLPAKLKKHQYIEEVKALKKSLKDQYVRAKQSFEASMESGEEFQAEELINLCKNPVLAPIIKNLVFICKDKIGYLEDGSLIDYNNNTYKLKAKDKLMIAHPVHLYEAGVWSDYQKDIFSKQLIQPFKQVFRELYLPNEDELKEGTLSRRYAGHQIQPKKTLALLKTRGWMASYEEGLQKVYYKEDIIATIYAMADWFSPADIEAPTIEYVRFEDRKTYKPVPLEKIPKLIFSEVMRDLDLVVSVAHVGGVDPEASLSTVEIRTVIIDELLKLLKLENVKLKGTHAHIDGVHGEYTVHLGSGVVHKMGTGSINILPVHSSHRGRIFLPFVDNDPKSAEIISKIILLAEDNKLKDPSILTQIVS